MCSSVAILRRSHVSRKGCFNQGGGGQWKFLRPEILKDFFHQFFSMCFLRVEKIWRCLDCFFVLGSLKKSRLLS